MNTKVLQIIYGVVLLIVLPLAAFMFLSNRNLQGETKKQTERIDSVEGKVFQLETINKILQKQVEEAKQKEASPVAEVKPAEPETPDKSQVRIQILNARGLQGVAGAVEALLTPVGYTVANKDNTRWQSGSTLAARSGFEVNANEIMNILKTDYDISQVDPLPTTVSDYDIVITIGSK